VASSRVSSRLARSAAATPARSPVGGARAACSRSLASLVTSGTLGHWPRSVGPREPPGGRFGWDQFRGRNDGRSRHRAIEHWRRPGRRPSSGNF
jgi:hypothetical protein